VEQALIDSAKAGFIEHFGYEPTGTWLAPGRVNLIGEHTDYNQGFVFPFAINRATYAAIALRSDQTVRVSSTFSSKVHETDLRTISRNDENDWAAYPFGVAWAIEQLSQKHHIGFDCFIDSDVPVGAGLSSSAAIECSVGVALNELWSTNLSRPELARAGQLAENEIVGAPTGIMDQSASLLGEKDCGVFLDCQNLQAEVVPLGFEAADLELLIIDTKVAHRHADGGYAARRAACELGAKVMGVPSLRHLSSADLPKVQELLDDEAFRRVRHVITENERVLETVRTLKAEGPTAIGNLLYESHQSMRDDFEISIPELDLAVETSLKNGSLGSRMTGGGFGGAAIALVPQNRVQIISEAVFSAFASNGYTKPSIFTVLAADGARRTR
jgi:galactokinase